MAETTLTQYSGKPKPCCHQTSQSPNSANIFTTNVFTTARDQPIMLLFLPIMLCCSALKIHLLYNYAQYYVQEQIFCQTIMLFI